MPPHDASVEAARFPPDFVWGIGTSAYQIEGSSGAADRGESVWDVFCRREGAVVNGDSGEIACDHVNRFRNDVALMRQIGVGSYRFSIAWPRVIPLGEGTPSDSGLAFYDALVDELLASNIEPWATLFHWDFPQALFQRGGWLNSESVDWFAKYTRVVVERLSDRVEHWITLNEPQCFLGFGHGDGTNAPGLKLPLADQLTAAHHALLAHGRAAEVIRETAKTAPTIGWAPVGIVKAPISNLQADIDAAEKATMDVPAESLWNNAWFNDPVFLGEYPEAGLRRYGDSVPAYTATEMQTIAQPVDFLGLNIYTAQHVKAGVAGDLPVVPGAPRSAFDWPVVDDSLYWGRALSCESLPGADCHH